MNRSSLDLSEFDRQKKLLFVDVGESGSGYVRYSAAMYFYKLGKLSLEMLEIYRRCCKFDFENPIKLAQHEGIEACAKHEFMIGG